MELIHNGERIPCDRVEQGKDEKGYYIRAYKNEMQTHDFSGITDLSGYQLIDENGNLVEFSTPEPTGIERIQALENVMLEILIGGEFSV